ncbi:hypothetical protein D3C73_853250 [compost metagenome]
MIKLEKISTLRENNYKRFKLETSDRMDSGYFVGEGVSDIKVDAHGVSFLFQGNINLIMRKLAALNLTNLWIEEPDLEEIFMHYYEKEDGRP